jgi:hypothetical protein
LPACRRILRARCLRCRDGRLILHGSCTEGWNGTANGLNSPRIQATLCAANALEPMLTDLRLKLMAGTIVMLLHVGLYQLLGQPQGALRSAGQMDEVMRVEFIERARAPELAPAPLPPRSRGTTARRARTEATRLPADTLPTPVDTEAASTGMSAAPLVMDWKEREPAVPEYRANLPPGEAPEDVAMAPADRLRLRRQLNGQDIVEGAARTLGLWPPGYEADPCPRVQRNIANLMTDTDPRGRERLGEELRRQRVACRG